MSSPGLSLPPGKHQSKFLMYGSDSLLPIRIFFFVGSKIMPRTITSNFGVSFCMIW